ncbi:hypothetical protein CLU79DRAFT_699151 [Phycomyces nitens]|nr:hypothetical protein CLU79DRAFT_699151 [Phycomyces nitens]
MQHKNGLKPKDPRIIDEYADDSDYDLCDELSLSGSSGTKKCTGTQALVEFLNTTSPEEFQKTIPKRASTMFFRRRKNKSSPSPLSTHSSPTTSTRPSLFSKRAEKMDADDRKILCHRSLPAYESLGEDDKRIVAQDTTEDTEAVLGSFPQAASEASIIEAGLRQRLDRVKLSGQEKPSNVLANVLAKEHVRALHSLHQSQYISPKRTGVRHVQVQTKSMDIPVDLASPPTSENSSLANHLNTLETMLGQERQERKKAQAALQDTMDHYEALSGLAYKKIRELWEEKERWEHLYNELQNRVADSDSKGSAECSKDEAVKNNLQLKG